MEMVLTGFSGMALMAFLFVIFYIQFGIEQAGIKKQLLTLFVLAVFLRIAKSFIYYVLTGISDLGVATGFLGYALMGPILFAYFKYNNGTKLLDLARREWMHWIIPIAGFISILFYRGYAVIPYRLGALSFALYLFFTLWRNQKEGTRISRWDRIFIGLSSSIAMIFLIQTFVPTALLYAVGTGMAALLMCLWFGYILINPMRLQKEVSAKPIQATDEQITRVLHALREEKIYRQSDLTLTSFSDQINVPQYLVSAIVKKEFGLTFPKTINKLRIEEVKSLLQQEESRNYKIESLAYDVGFSSPSNFYTAFKRETGFTPRRFQETLFS